MVNLLNNMRGILYNIVVCERESTCKRRQTKKMQIRIIAVSENVVSKSRGKFLVIAATRNGTVTTPLSGDTPAGPRYFSLLATTTARQRSRTFLTNGPWARVFAAIIVTPGHIGVYNFALWLPVSISEFLQYLSPFSLPLRDPWSPVQSLGIVPPYRR